MRLQIRHNAITRYLGLITRTRDLEHRNQQLKRLVELSVTLNSTKIILACVNLLNNAVRFLLPGAKLLLVWQQGDHVPAWVQDHGIGIASDKLKKIFWWFYQAKPSNMRHYGGLGIGLTIAKGQVEAQSGKIWAESEGVGKGSTFKVLLPKV